MGQFSTIIHQPSSIIHQPPSILHQPLSIIHQPSKEYLENVEDRECKGNVERTWRGDGDSIQRSNSAIGFSGRTQRSCLRDRFRGIMCWSRKQGLHLRHQHHHQQAQHQHDQHQHHRQHCQHQLHQPQVKAPQAISSPTSPPD